MSQVRVTRDASGSVLILALWVLFFLAVLAMAIGAHVAGGIRLAAGMKSHVVSRALARAGVAHTAMLVACNTNAWDGLSSEAWNARDADFGPQDLPPGSFEIYSPYRLPDGTAATNRGIVGAESRLNVNRFNKRIMEALLMRVGMMGADEAAAFIEAVDQYRREKAERVLTMQRGADYPQPDAGEKAELDHVAELMFVEGMSEAVYQQVYPFLTTIGSGRVNVNSADVELLRCCVDAYPVAEAYIEEALSNRQEGRDETDPGRVAVVAFLTLRSTAFRGVAVGRAHGEESRIEFVVDEEGRRLFWNEF